MTAFDRLSTTRPSGFDVGKIPWTAMVQYAAIQELDAENTEMLVAVIRAMDEVYVAWSAEEQKRNSKKNSTEED